MENIARNYAFISFKLLPYRKFIVFIGLYNICLIWNSLQLKNKSVIEKIWREKVVIMQWKQKIVKEWKICIVSYPISSENSILNVMQHRNGLFFPVFYSLKSKNMYRSVSTRTCISISENIKISVLDAWNTKNY
jgi:hypothetical protein